MELCAGAGATAVADKGLKPMAKILGHTTHSRHPSEFTLAPIDAIKTLLDRLSWQTSDVDLFEINEAFAMVTAGDQRSRYRPRQGEC